MIKFIGQVISIEGNKDLKPLINQTGNRTGKMYVRDNGGSVVISIPLDEFLGALSLMENDVRERWNMYPVETRWSFAELAYALVEGLDKIPEDEKIDVKNIRRIIREFADEVFSRVEMDDELLEFAQNQQSPNASR